jgi:hypothetical protein
MRDISKADIFVLLVAAVVAFIGLVVSNIAGPLYGLYVGICVFGLLYGMAVFNLAETNWSRLFGSLIMATAIDRLAEVAFTPIFGFSVWPYAFLSSLIYFLIQILRIAE